MALSEEELIIIIVVSLVVGLGLSIAICVYMCCCRGTGQVQGDAKHSKRRRRQIHMHSSREDPGGKASLSALPNAAETKKMEEGQTFVDVREQNGKKAASGDGPNYIMGPSADLAEREDDNRIGNDNEGFTKDNQVESGAYLRGGVDPADVAEAYMQDEYLKEASKTRRQQQLQVRKKVSKNSSNGKKQSAKRTSSKQNHGNKQKRSSSKKKSSEM